MMIWPLRTGEGPRHAQGWGEGKHVCCGCPGAKRSYRSYSWCRGHCATHNATADDVTESDSSAHSEADTKAHAAPSY